jgi:hypothetical protein
MITIPIPADLALPEVPDGETIQLPVTFKVTPAGLEVVDIDGVPVTGAEEEQEEVAEEAPENEDFMSAVNRQLQ